MVTGIVIPVYATSQERLELLEVTLKSTAQQRADVVVLVIDDCSPLQSHVEALVQSMQNDSLRFIPRERKPEDITTASNAINCGLDILLDRDETVLTQRERSSLDAACYLHSDDALTPASIARRKEALGPYGVVHSQTLLIDRDGRPMRVVGKRGIKCGAHGFSHHSTLWSYEFLGDVRRYAQETYGQASVFDPQLFFGEDRDGTLTTIEASIRYAAPIRFVPGITYCYRKHDDSICGTTDGTEVWKQHRMVNAKHGISVYTGIVHRLSTDLPWSLATYTPEPVKKRLRGVRDSVKSRFGQDLGRRRPMN